MIKRILSLGFLCLVFSFTSAQICSKTQLPANLQNGMVAYYPFCSNVNDQGGNAYNGTITAGAVPFVNDRFGNASSAVQLGGGYIVTNTGAFNFQQNQTFTISIWFTLETNSSSGRLLSTECPEGNFRIGAGLNGNYSVQYGDYIDDKVSLNTWTHLVYTYDNRSEKVYINGVLKYSKTEATNLTFTHCPLTIGAKASSAFDRWVGKADDLMVYNRALSACEVSQMYNATSGNIPQLQTPAFNTLADTTKACGPSTILDAGSGYASYSWNTGATSQTISASSGGWYKVTITNTAGCSASDSTYLNIVKSNIIQSDTTICKGASIQLSIDSTFSSTTSCNSSTLPGNLRNGLVAYYPFCGNANDASGNSNNGTVNGATLTPDRFGKPNSAYSFNGVNNYIDVPYNTSMHGKTGTINVWIKSNGQLNGQRLIFGQPNGRPQIVVTPDLSPGRYNSRIQWKSTTGFAGANSNSDVLNSQWMMITGVYSSTSFSIYINGILDNTVQINSTADDCSTSSFQIGGFNPASSQCNNILGLTQMFNGLIDDISVYNRILSPTEIFELSRVNTETTLWSTGATGNSITVAPTQTTKYYVTVSDGITSCQDSVTVTVSDIVTFNPLQDTTRVCGDSIILDAGSGFATYNWSNGATTQKITAKSGGKYVVNVNNAAGCSASDTALVSIVKAKILQRDTTICKGATILLNIDSTTSGAFNSSLPTNLRNGLVAYFPFNGNANDESGNGNDGIVNGAVLTEDRFGKFNMAYRFQNSDISVPMTSSLHDMPIRSTSLWFYANGSQNGGRLYETTYRNGGIGLYNGNILDAWYSNSLKECNVTNVNSGTLNTWHHLVYVANSNTGNGQVYLDGVLVKSRIGVFVTSPQDWPNQFMRFGKGASNEMFNGKIDDILIYNRELTADEIQNLFTEKITTKWSTGNTSNSITVSPTQTTKYYVTVSDGITSCQDSITVTVSDIGTFNPLQDTIRVCGDSVILDAGSGYATYNWSNGATTQKITVKSGGKYKLNVTTAAGCSSSDSSFVSIVKAKILQRDTTICKGASITLNTDSSIIARASCNLTDIQTNLQNGLLGYWPFCNNLNDASGNGRHATNYGAVLAKDRFGNPGNAMGFSLTALNREYITVPGINVSGAGSTGMSLSLWYKRLPQSTSISTLFRQEGSCNFPDFLIQSRTTGIETGIRTSSYSSSFSNYTIDTNWHMISFTYDQSQLRTYLDGNLIATQARTGSVSFLENTSYIGICGSLVDHQFAGYIDDIGIWNRPLSAQELTAMVNGDQNALIQRQWSTGATTNAITVTPSQTTKYFLTVSDGITSCKDSITVTIDQNTGFNSLQDTIRVCGDSVVLDAGSGYATYNWSNGSTTQKITAKSSGKYVVSVVTASGCTASDSSLVSIVKAKILQRDTIICKGASITLSIDSSSALSGTACNVSQLPANLRNGLMAYYPFCGNANDASGNGYNGTVFGATPTNDRFNKASNAYSFNGTTSYISTADIDLSTEMSISAWVKPKGLLGALVDKSRDVSSNAGYTLLYNNTPNGGRPLYGLYAHVGWSGTPSNNLFPNPPIEVKANSWHHCVMTYKSGTAKIYLDGILISSQTMLNPISQNNELMLIGKSVWGGNLLNGDLDDVMLYNRSISDLEVAQLYNNQTVSWSNGSSLNSIIVTPTQTTKYYVTVSDGITSCQDSITVSVSDIGTFNPLQDTIRVCGDSVILDAGSGYASYNWSNGATTQKITAKNSGKYTVTVANASGCTASDSSLVSIVKAKILQRDTTICKGASITLSIDSSFAGSATVCNSSQLPANLRNGLVAYYPFCGNANDVTGNGRNGTVNGASLINDRFGNPNQAYSFDGINDYIIANGGTELASNERTISYWLVADPNLYGELICLGSSSSTYWGCISANGVTRMNYGRGCGESGTFLSPTYNLNQWYHVTFVSSTNGSSKIYINGKLIGTSNHGLPTTCSTQNLYFGVDIFSVPEYHKIKLDEVMIWNRQLSESEVQKLFQNQSVQWSTGSTTNSITVSPTQSTKYYVTVSDGITSCTDSVTVTVAQLDTAITALDPTSVCSTGGTVRLQAGTASSYQWLKDGAVISGATARLYSATQTGSYRVVVTNAAGCSDTSRAIAIVLDPKPVPNFTINNNAQCLTENAFNFTNTSTISAGTMTYVWSLGDGTTATSTDASRTYTTAGTYNIKLVATSNRSCSDSITKSITVYPQPATPTITGADEFCSGATIVLNTNAPAARQWYRNNVLVTNGTGTSLTIQQPGDYKVSTVNANGCTTFSTVKTITENPLPQGSLAVPTSLFICEGTPYTLTASGAASYQWYFNNNIIAGETSASLITGIPGNYKVQFVSDKGCRAMSTNSIDLTLIKAPDAAFSYDTYCLNVQTNFSSRSTTNQSGTVTYAWNFGDGNAAGNTTNTFNTYTRSGNFTVTLTVTPNACTQLADSAQAVIAIQAPTPGIQYSPINAIINKPQPLSARSIGNSYLWSPGTFLSTINSRTPTINASREQLYRIIITNAAGCTTVDTQLVRVFADRNIYVPEGFTPDNDGRNDRLYPILVGIREMKIFRIYNRWGLLVYDNKNANANTGWDGTYKGTRQPMETYAWVAEGIDIDGNPIRRTGNTILIR